MVFYHVLISSFPVDVMGDSQRSFAVMCSAFPQVEQVKIIYPVEMTHFGLYG